MVGKAPDPNSDSPVTEEHIEYAINEIGKVYDTVTSKIKPVAFNVKGIAKLPHKNLVSFESDEDLNDYRTNCADREFAGLGLPQNCAPLICEMDYHIRKLLYDIKNLKDSQDVPFHSQRDLYELIKSFSLEYILKECGESN